MKRGGLLFISCLVLFGLSACQILSPTAAESCWDLAKEGESFMEYIVKEKETIDVEALKSVATSEESSLSQQFKATALLCGLDYWKDAKVEDIENPWYEIIKDEDNSAFHQNDWESASYAEQYLEQISTDEEAFWESLNDAFVPYDCLLPIFAAAEQLDGQTMERLIKGPPADKNYGDKFKDAVGQWIKKKPEKIFQAEEDFIKDEYFREWNATDWKETYFYSEDNPDLIHTNSVMDAMAYISYLRTAMLPMLETEFRGVFKTSSEVYDGKTYSTGLMVVVDETLHLNEQEDGNLPEWIETQGKKVAAFYQNPYSVEKKGSPAPLQVIGDFMLNLPEEEFPKTMEEVDYYLILTPQYEPGGFYQDKAGKKTEIQMINSSTFMDLYEAKTGRFLRHLGTVREEAPSKVTHNMDHEPVEYPKPVKADELLYIYHNINDPVKYTSLVEHKMDVQMDLAADEPLLLGKWEITYHCGKIAESFQDDIFQYTAEDGSMLAIGTFTVTNRGTKGGTFLPIMYNPSKEMIVKLTDSKRENFYDSAYVLSDSKNLKNVYFEQGETKEGEIIFQIPKDALEQKETFHVAVTLDEKTVFYPFR